MLEGIRERAQGWLSWVLVVLFSSIFAVWGVEYYINHSARDEWVAKVDGHGISKQRFHSLYERLRREYIAQSGTPPIEEREQHLKQQALDGLLNLQVLSRSAQKMGFHVSSTMVQRQLASIAAFHENGQFSAQRFAEALSQMQYREDQFLDELQSALLIDQLGEGISLSSFSLNNEVLSLAKLLNERRDIAYIKLPLSQFKSSATISEEEIQKYYRDHSEEFVRPEQVKISYIQLSLSDLKKEIIPSGNELKEFYKQNLTHFTEPTQWKIAHILFKDAPENNDQAIQKKIQLVQQKLKEGRSFSEIAKQYSDDPTSAEEGGALPWLSQGSLDPQIEDTLNQMAVNSVSEPVHTKYGYMLIKLLDKKEAKPKPFESVRNQVEKSLVQQKIQQRFEEQKDQLMEISYSNPTSLTVVAEALKLPIQTTEFFTRNGQGSGLTAHPKVIQAAFSPEVLDQHNNSELIQITPDTAVILRVEEHLPSQIKPLAEVKANIISKLRQQAQSTEVKKVAQQLADEWKKGNDWEALSARMGLEYVEKNGVQRNGSALPSLLTQATFKLPRTTVPGKAQGVTVLEMPSGECWVVGLKKVYEDMSRWSPSSQQAFRYQLASMYGQLDYILYVQGQMKEARITKFLETEKTA